VAGHDPRPRERDERAYRDPKAAKLKNLVRATAASIWNVVNCLRNIGPGPHTSH
jgi:hypothetical protein